MSAPSGAIRHMPHADAENMSPHTPAVALLPAKTTLSSPTKLGHRDGGLLPLFNVRVLALEGGAVRWYVVRVSIPGRSWQVTRRYSEFAKLHSRLQQLTASSLPDIPGKVLLHTQAELCNRVVGLQRFCDRLLQQAHCKHSRQGPDFFAVLYEFFGLEPGVWCCEAPSRAPACLDRTQERSVLLLQAHARRRAQQRSFRQQIGAANTLQVAARARAAQTRGMSAAALLTMAMAAVLIGLEGGVRSVA